MEVRVRVKAGAAHERVKEEKGVLNVSVREPAAGNRANARVRAILALRYKTFTNKVRLVGGAHSPNKRFLIPTP